MMDTILEFNRLAPFLNVWLYGFFSRPGHLEACHPPPTKGLNCQAPDRKSNVSNVTRPNLFFPLKHPNIMI